jgi:hypothetical protein
MSKKTSVNCEKSLLKKDVDTSCVFWRAREIDFADAKKRLTQNDLPFSKRGIDKKPNKEPVDTEDLEEPWYFVHV